MPESWLQLLPVLSLVAFVDLAHCFTTPVAMNPNAAPYRGGSSSAGGPSWATMTAASASSSPPPPPPITGVDLSRYVQRGSPSPPLPGQQQQQRRRKAPIYIPIGPPCAGKTTILSRILVPANMTASQQFSQNHHPTAAGRTAGRDISIDDQDGVYMQIPTRLFLVGDPKTDTPKAGSGDAKLLNRTVHGKTIYERLHSDGSNNEMIAVLRRLAGRIGRDEFRETIMRQMGCWNATAENADNTTTGRDTTISGNTEEEQHPRSVGRHGGPLQIPPSIVAQYLIEAVEHYAETETLTSSGHLRDENHPILGRDGCSDLFVLESIFRSANVVEGGRSRTRPSGLNLAISKMERLACNASALPSDVPLAWGNTNTRPREYTSALEVAEKSGRPAVFVPHVNPTVVSVWGEGGPGNASEFLNHCDLDELLRRSIGRIVNTGRYVPANSIKDAAFRCDSLMMSAKAEMGRMFPTVQAHTTTTTTTTAEDKAAATEGDNVNALESARTFTKFQLECSLAKMAGYQMNADRTVVKIRNDNASGNRGGRGGYRDSGRCSGRDSFGRGQYRGGRGGNGSGYGRGYDDRNSGGRSWNSRQGPNGGRGRGYAGEWNTYGREDSRRNDQQKRSWDGNRQWSPSRQPIDNRTAYPR